MSFFRNINNFLGEDYKKIIILNTPLPLNLNIKNNYSR